MSYGLIREMNAKWRKCACYYCGAPYGTWPDYQVEPETWLKYGPTGHEGGLLCLNCLAQQMALLADARSQRGETSVRIDPVFAAKITGTADMTKEQSKPDPTTSPASEQVIQADRDEAAAFIERNPWVMAGPSDWVTAAIREIRAGRKDGNCFVQALARYRRLAIEASGLVECVEALKPFADAYTKAKTVADIAPVIQTSLRHVTANDFRAAYTALSNIQPSGEGGGEAVTMREIIARRLALRETESESPWQAWLDDADAVLRAMREHGPTEAMIRANIEGPVELSQSPERQIALDWQIMLDAALSEVTP